MPPVTCPNCSHTFGTGGRRICYLCKKPILRRHKWVFVGSRVRHRLCDDPNFYIPEKERNKRKR